jgi:hypothetical protein
VAIATVVQVRHAGRGVTATAAAGD